MLLKEAPKIVALLIAAAALLYVFVHSGAPQKLEQHAFRGAVMGTTYEIKVVHQFASAEHVSQLMARVDQRLQAIDQSMSSYQSQSELMRFNRAPQDAWFSLSVDAMTVLSLANRVAVMSGGMYDYTITPLLQLWGFGSDAVDPQLPDAEHIEAAQSLVGYSEVDIDMDNLRARKTAPRLLDISSVAKGYGVDEAARVLDEAGISNYLIEVGGEVLAHGHNSRGEPWVLAIEKPGDLGRVIHTIVELSGTALATSGDYRNYWEDQGKRYSHIINPISGRPVDHRLASVSVIGASAAEADAYATLLFVLGDVAGKAFADANQIPALFITRSDSGFAESYSAGFRSYVR